MGKLYILGSLVFILGLITTVIQLLLYGVGIITIDKWLVVVWGILSLVVYFEGAIDFLKQYNKIKTTEENI